MKVEVVNPTSLKDAIKVFKEVLDKKSNDFVNFAERDGNLVLYGMDATMVAYVEAVLTMDKEGDEDVSFAIPISFLDIVDDMITPKTDRLEIEIEEGNAKFTFYEGDDITEFVSAIGEPTAEPVDFDSRLEAKNRIVMMASDFNARVIKPIKAGLKKSDTVPVRISMDAEAITFAVKTENYSVRRVIKNESALVSYYEYKEDIKTGINFPYFLIVSKFPSKSELSIVLYGNDSPVKFEAELMDEEKLRYVVAPVVE